MGTFSSADLGQLNSLNVSVQSELASASSVESAAQILVEKLYNSYQDSAVLIRLYATVPFKDLPDFNRKFVTNLAEANNVAGDLKDETQILSLLATFGKESNWRDRTKSHGHVGIPLISSKFVDEIPMISRLLQQVGVGLNWLDPEDIKIVAKDVTKLSGMFYLSDAATETDSRGRKVIPMQDFVSQFGVKTVFGFARGYSNGMMAVLVVFTSESVDEGKARPFESLLDTFKGKTESLAVAGKVFS